MGSGELSGGGGGEVGVSQWEIRLIKVPKLVLFHLMIHLGGGAVYRVALIQSRGIYLVVTHRTAKVRVTLDRPVTLGLFPVELSTHYIQSTFSTFRTYFITTQNQNSAQ